MKNCICDWVSGRRYFSPVFFKNYDLSKINVQNPKLQIHIKETTTTYTHTLVAKD